MATPAFTLPSPQTGTDYWIYVDPPDEAKHPGPWSVMLCMDGDDQFGTMRTAAHAVRSHRHVPPLLLVGVGYGATYRRPENRRVRDYTPTALATEADSGGLDRFLDFLADTLLPEIVRRYPVGGDVRGIAGHSLGALVALHALLAPRLGFTHALVSAPSLWWDDRSPLRLVAGRRKESAELRARLYVSVGADDTESMTGDLTLLEQQLAAQPFTGLETTFRRHADRDHYNVLPDAFRDGLVTLFK